MAPAAPVPESSIPRKRATPSRAIAAVLLGGVFVLAMAFLIAGTLLTVGLFVVPALFLIAVLYLWFSARRGAPRDTGLDANPEGSGAARPGPRGGTYG